MKYNIVNFHVYRFLEDLEEGIYIQQTTESVLLNEDGKQLMVGIHMWTMLDFQRGLLLILFHSKQCATLSF